MKSGHPSRFYHDRNTGRQTDRHGGTLDFARANTNGLDKAAQAYVSTLDLYLVLCTPNPEPDRAEGAMQEKIEGKSRPEGLERCDGPFLPCPVDI